MQPDQVIIESQNWQFNFILCKYARSCKAVARVKLGGNRLSKRGFDSEDKTAGLEYQSYPTVIRTGLIALDIRHQDYTFIDVGCGKGRVSRIASERWTMSEVVTNDSMQYEFDAEPQVLYFYSAS